MRFDPGNFIRDNRLWRTHLFHQIVVPLAVDLEMCQRAEFHRFDQHVIEVDVNARLTKSIESGSRASTPNEPRLEILFRRIMETARFPHIISMAADEMRPAIAVRLGVNNQHGFADLRLESILARERANLALENNMRGNELAHEFEGLGKEETRVGEALKFTILAARNIEVVFADVVDAITTVRLSIEQIQLVILRRIVVVVVNVLKGAEKLDFLERVDTTVRLSEPGSLDNPWRAIR